GAAGTRVRAGALPPLRQHHGVPPQRDRPPAPRPRPRRPPLGGRALAAAPPVPRPRDGERAPPRHRHVPRHRARPRACPLPDARRPDARAGHAPLPAARSHRARGRPLHRDDRGARAAGGPGRRRLSRDGGEPLLRRRGGPPPGGGGAPRGAGGARGRRAADRALAQLAYEEGARQYQAALDLLAAYQPIDEAERVDLLLGLGEAWRRTGDVEMAKETIREAAEGAQRLGAAELLAR